MFSETNATWSSECSSTRDSEEAAEAELHDSHSTLIGSKQNYLSALRFSIASSDNSCQKLVQLDKSCNIGSNFSSKGIKTDSHGQWMNLDPELEESTGSCMDTKYRGLLCIMLAPLVDYLEILFMLMRSTRVLTVNIHLILEIRWETKKGYIVVKACH